jgi:hypothetical protein
MKTTKRDKKVVRLTRTMRAVAKELKGVNIPLPSAHTRFHLLLFIHNQRWSLSLMKHSRSYLHSTLSHSMAFTYGFTVCLSTSI